MPREPWIPVGVFGTLHGMTDNESLTERVARSTAAAVAGAAPTGLAATALAAGLAAGSEVLIEVGDRLHRSSPTQRLLEAERAVRQDRARELEEYAPELGKKLERLVEVFGPKPGFVSNVATRFSAFREARDRSDNPKKTRILLGALCGALDPEAYRESMTFSLFAVLRDIDYGEIRALNAAKHESTLLSQFPGSAQGDTRFVRPASKLHLHLGKLRDHGLIYMPPNRDNLFAFGGIIVTEVGDEMIKLIGSDAFREAEEI